MFIATKVVVGRRFAQTLALVAVGLVLAAPTAASRFAGAAETAQQAKLRKDALAVKGNPTRGRAHFTELCSGCHGADGRGDIGPSLIDLSKRLAKEKIIDQILQPRGRMPALEPGFIKPQQLADLVAFLNDLK
jgi:mono/diheme cytochrome c family protein